MILIEQLNKFHNNKFLTNQSIPDAHIWLGLKIKSNCLQTKYYMKKKYKKDIDTNCKFCINEIDDLDHFISCKKNPYNYKYLDKEVIKILTKSCKKFKINCWYNNKIFQQNQNNTEVQRYSLTSKEIIKNLLGGCSNYFINNKTIILNKSEKIETLITKIQMANINFIHQRWHEHNIK